MGRTLIGMPSGEPGPEHVARGCALPGNPTPESAPPNYPVPSVRAPVEVLVDEFGVAHLYAECEDDLFRAQGFNAARDRLFQLDLWRRRGLGRLAEVFGPRFVARDRAARLFLYRGDMRAEWLAYGSATKRVVTAFVGGINAYVELCERRPELLPVEFRELGYRPARWEPRDVAVIRSHGLVHNLEQEVARALTLRDYSTEVEDLRRVREPAHRLRVPEGLDLADIPDDVLEVYRLATGPLVFAPDHRPGLETDDYAGPPSGWPGATSGTGGSNNWVIGASRTATGRPLLANDPHRVVGLPSLRYLVHLSAPGLDVIGAGEPALPGVSIGHNGHLAFGLTIFPIDQEDLYVYRTNPANPDEYRYAGLWEPMRVIRETVEVAGGPPVRVELRFTRHGPVIATDAGRHTAFAVRTVWLEPGTAPYLGSMDYMRAHTADEFVDAMNRWGAPGENQVYAAPDGTIGWRPAGLVPIRPNWDGTLPVPGDGRYEWAGFHDVDQLPAERNPARDWLATANEMNLPADYPNQERTVSYDWAHRDRYERIAEVLSTATGWTVEGCVRLQCDTVNAAARPVLEALAQLDPEATPGITGALDLLRAWDRDETIDSATAALYQIWFHRHLRPELLRHALTALVAPESVEAAVRRLTPDETLSADVRADMVRLEKLRADRPALDAILAGSLRSAWHETVRRLGDDPARWRWGALHHAAPVHPLADRLAGDWPRLPRLERAGSGDTVMSAPYDQTFRQSAGATFRIVVDVGEWDNSRAMNSPGQSGRPDDPHWSDLYPLWAADGSVPLYYTRAAVEAHTRARYTLSPAGRP
jgi:penicillin G amidase